MEVILNELSLDGQYADVRDFCDRGLMPVHELLTEIMTDKQMSLLKKSDFFNVAVTPRQSFYEIIFSEEARTDERLRRFKSLLSRLQNKPFWDMEQKHLPEHKYVRIDSERNDPVSGHGVAEAHARDACIISFLPSDYEPESITVKNLQLDSEKVIGNPHNRRQLLFNSYRKGDISLQEYIRRVITQKFNFEYVNPAHGLNLINNLNEDIFLSSFDNFESKTWHQIEMDNGLDFKPFSKNKRTRRFFSADEWEKGIWKFRIDQEKRCFGRREGDVFYVLRIDLDHKLSDLG